MFWVYVPKRCLQRVLTLLVVSACGQYTQNCVEKRAFQLTGLVSSWYKSITSEQPQCLGGNPGNIRQICAVLFLGKE